MLAALNIAETLEIPYSGVIPVTPVQRFNLRPGIAYNFAFIVSTITAAAAVVLPGFSVNDETGTLIATIAIVPFQFAGSTVSTTTMQPPSVPITAFFAPAILGMIPSNLHVFDGWTIQFTDFLATPGVTVDAVFTLNRV